ncbi:ANTAR domain-containing protein [Streptomyces sp. NPDC046925]|uniref:ANTAR domain-containing protein n=1 Tax=Streptomyces sp. NPDC046925 TaxID=3155375 RepID=UPI0033CC4010
MTDRALPAQLAQDSEATPTAGPTSDVGRDSYSRAEQEPHSRAGQDPDDELVQLRRAMETRPVIDMARGVLMASFGLSADDAWSVLVSVSQNTNTKLHTVADELIGAVAGGEIPQSFRRELSATVARLQTPSPASGTDEE